jgi:toxin ParE1/3/4
MAIVILPDAQADLLDLQDYMLQRWTPKLWQSAEDDIFAQLAQVDSGFITGPVVPLLASVGITDYRTVLSSHHRILYRQTDGHTYVYAVAGQTQDFQTLLLRRLFRR